MANRVPLIVNTSSNQIQELPSGDNLDLTGSGIHNAGVITATSFVGSGANLTGIDATSIKDPGGNVKVQAQTSGAMHTGISTFGDIDVDGHTNLDNISVAGVSTFAGAIDLNADVDIDGHTELDHVNVAGIATFNGHRIDISTWVSHVGDPDTRFGFWGPDELTFEAAGTERVHINSSGLQVTNGAGLHVAGVSTFAGNVTIGGTLTYEDVTNIDSVGLITARNGINVSGGTATFASDLDVDGHTNLDNVSIAGVTTVADNSKLAFGTGEDLSLYHLTADNDGYIKYQNENGHLKIGSGAGGNGGIQLWNRTYNKSYITCDSDDAVKIYFNNSKKIETTNTGAQFTGTDFGFNTTPGGTPASKNVFLAIGDSDTGIVQDGDGQLELWANNTEVANINAIDGYTSTKPITTTNNISGNAATFTGDLTAKSALFTDDGTASPIVDIRSDDGSPWQLQIANDAYSTGAYGLNLHLDSAGNGYMRLQTGASSAYKNLYLGLNNGTTTKECLTLTSTSTTSLNRITAPSMTINDNGSTGPLLNIRADDNSPWAFAVGNDSYHASKGLHFYQENNGDFYHKTYWNGEWKNYYLQVSDTSTTNNAIIINNARAVQLCYQGNIKLYTASNGVEVNGQFTSSNSGASNLSAARFANNTSSSNAHCRVQIATAANQGGDPYIHFDAGGSNMIVGNYWAGTTNNYLLMGPGESPEGGTVNNGGMRVKGNGRCQMPLVWSTNGSSMRDVQIESDGTLCAGNTSIRAAKKNIVSQTDVSWLYDLNPVTFNYRKKTVGDDNKNTYLDEVEEETSYGLIAEEVETVKKDFCFYNKDKDGNDELAGVGYHQLITPLLKALQDQKKEIDDLKAKVVALESS